MAHASMQLDLPELPDAIRSRLVSHRAAAVEEGLRGLGYWYPGLFDAMMKTIDLLEAEPGIEAVTVDYDGEDALYPATIWAESTFPLDERLERVAVLEARTDELLARYPDVVLVAIQ